jgi:hypothetical protein
VRIYDRELLKSRDIVADFFSVMGYREYKASETPPQVNQSFDAKILQFLLLFNKHLPRFRDNRLNPERAGLANALAAISTAAGPSLPAEELRQVFKLFERSNAVVAKRFLGSADGVLFPNVRFAEGTKTAELTVEDAVEIAAHLWRWKRSDGPEPAHDKPPDPTASVEELVAAAYKAVLGRQPDARGMQTYAALFQGVAPGQGVVRTVKGLLGSKEFQQKYARKAAPHPPAAEQPGTAPRG